MGTEAKPSKVEKPYSVTKFILTPAYDPIRHRQLVEALASLINPPDKPEMTKEQAEEAARLLINLLAQQLVRTGGDVLAVLGNREAEGR